MTASRERPTPAPAATRALCAFAAAMSRGDETAAAAALEAARRTRTARHAAEETALMLMLYAGFPGALEGLRVLNGTWPGRARRTREGVPATWRRRGLALCGRVYGPAIARLLPAVRALHPDLEVWMVEHGYGRVLSRPGLGARERELITVSALAALGWERQLVSHVLGAFRVGARADQVREALAIGERAGGPRERAIARRTWDRARRLQGARGAGLERTRHSARPRGFEPPAGRERTGRVARRRSASK